MRPYRFAPILLTLFLWITPTMAQELIPCTVIQELPHDAETSTQGLFFHDEKFYESSGGYARSFLTVVGSHTLRRLRTIPLPNDIFAEGIAPDGDTLRLVTWKSGIGMVHRLDDLTQVGQFAYRPPEDHAEGWGLTHDGEDFILSMGTATLRYQRSDDFSLIRKLKVTENGKLVKLLNELEYVEDMIYANIWKSDDIVIIDPATGEVRARIDLSPLRKRISAKSGVANGIAYDKKGKRLFVTGKHWDKLFEIAIPKL